MNYSGSLISNVEALQAPCPKCGAVANEKCRRDKGPDRHHRERMTAARRARSALRRAS